MYLSEQEFRTLAAVCDLLMPPDEEFVGAVAAGAPTYIDTFLGAFSFDPPKIWAKGPTSGRFVEPSGEFHPLSRIDELAWRTRIEGSKGLSEREWNGPVTGLQQQYHEGLAALGEEFPDLDDAEKKRRLDRGFAELVFGHCCEGVYGAPEYGGTGDGWRSISFDGGTEPFGWTDAEVTTP